jgi:tetraacyldisaccharide 4'-kinase
VRRALGALFGRVARARARAYTRGLLPRHRLAGPVASVGNLSVGGNGKTPVVQWLAERLRGGERTVAVLSRGYGGRFRGDALIVGDGRGVHATADQAGDEPVMLARSLPGVVVAVGPRRDVVGREVERRFGPCVHVLDDGFQHLRLHRDLDVVCLDVRDLDDRPLPAGRLREGPEALGRADILLLTRLEAATEEERRALEKRLGPERTFRVSRQTVGWRTLDGREVAPPGRVFLFAGIARPERFETDAASTGTSVVGRELFPDHHRYQARQVERLMVRARDAGAEALATTAKDAVRVEGLVPGEPGLPILVLPLAVSFSNEQRLWEKIVVAVGGSR